MRVRKCGWFRLLRGEKEDLQRLLPRVEVQITLHTPPSFTGCFPAECRPSQPCCTKKRGFFTPYTPDNAAVFQRKRLFFHEMLPIFASCCLDEVQVGVCFARRIGIQVHGFVQEALGARLLCAAAPASSAAYCQNACWIGCLSSSIVPPSHRCPCPPSLSAVMAMHLHCDQSRLAWRAFLFCRGEVHGPKGGSNPCDRIPIDRAALSREFPRN